MINKNWPLFVRIALAPVAIVGIILSGPIVILLMAAREEEMVEKIMEFFLP